MHCSNCPIHWQKCIVVTVAVAAALAVKTGSDPFLSTDLGEMFTQTTPKTDSTLVIESRNNEPENAYFAGRLSPKTQNEVFKEGQTFEVIQDTVKVLRDENNNDSNCTSDSMKLLIKAKEPENGQGDLLSSSATTEDTVAMTANNEFALSDDDVDMLTHQTGISNIYRIYVYTGV